MSGIDHRKSISDISVFAAIAVKKAQGYSEPTGRVCSECFHYRPPDGAGDTGKCYANQAFWFAVEEYGTCDIHQKKVEKELIEPPGDFKDHIAPPEDFDEDVISS